jgi:hypothetical protein
MKGTMIKPTLEKNAEVPDIPMMYNMTESEYRKYLEGDKIMFIDHHDVIRDGLTSRPLATTSEQLEMLIEWLENCRRWMKPMPKEE